MKKSIITIYLLLVSIVSFSQNSKQEREDKIKALKIAYLTENLNLSTSEAQKFWPVYNKFEEEQQSLKKAMHDKRRNINFEVISETEAQKLIDEMETLNTKRCNVNIAYMKELKKVLSAKKILLLKSTEDNFKRKMFEEFRKRKEEK